MSIWAKMSQIDIRDIQEKKQGFTYLSWSHALRLLKEHAPQARVVKHTFEVGGVMLPYMRDEAGYAYVMVTVDLGNGDQTTEIMPVLNHANRPIQGPNSFEVNAQLQRCMAKAISMSCGLGIHLYAGEDVPRPVEAVGGDNSPQQAASGSASVATPTARMKSMAPVGEGLADPTVTEAHTPMKKIGVHLHDLIANIKTKDELRAFYKEHKAKVGDVDPVDKQIFEARAKEIDYNG